MMSRIYLLFFTVLFFAACNSTDSSKLFTQLDDGATGINFRNTLFEDGPLNVANYIYFYNGGGVAIGDINNDSLQDILFTGNMVRNRLFLNKGNFKFEDVTDKAGIDKKQGWCTGASMVDINGDGKLDIYICRSADINPDMRSNLLYINNGDMSFSEKAAEYGLADSGYSTQAAFFDYDKDGDLDCFIINHSLQKYTAGVQENPELRNEHNAAFANKLYRNDNNHFADVSAETGITSNVLTFGLGIAISDYNNDGWPDISVSNDFNEPDYLFINNRNGTFTEQIAKCMDQVSLYSMGSDAADYNNDGYTDLLTLDMMPEDNKTQKMHSGAENYDKFQYLFSRGFYYQYSRNMLQKNNGDGTFSEVGQLAGVSNTDWSWAALFGDYDNDGYKDLFVTNGYVKDYTDMDFMKYQVDRLIRSMNKDSVDAIPEYLKKMPTNVTPNYIFKNNGDETFTKKTTEWGLGQPGVSAGAAYADFDNDGDLDLVVNNSNDLASIYRNNSERLLKNNYLRVALHGDKENNAGIGAKVTLYCQGQEYYQEQSPVRGFQSSVAQVLVFGTGDHAQIDSVSIIWPDNKRQLLANIKSGSTLHLNQADAKGLFVYDTLAHHAAYFTTAIMPQVKHTENDFNDFTVQPLLPNFLSKQGPCIAVADINNDHLDDFFFGQGKGTAAGIFIQSPDGGFKQSNQPALVASTANEDAGAVFFDADKDGDMDLYVCSGGYEFAENDAALQDRLYTNDGKGNFAKKEDALPQMLTSTSCVTAGDIDGDGDADLFVGGRLVPGKYPETPNSYILINDGAGKFTNHTETIAPAIKNMGMVTDAVFTDLNKDGNSDLIIVGEWMPIKVFISSKTTLKDESSNYIKFASNGWWNRIHASDMDNDGDLDLVIGNCGLNTQFRTSEKEPMTIYYKDFDKNGSVDPVLCYYIKGVSYPAFSRDDIADQIPSLKKKFLEYNQYAVATINEVFSPEQLSDAKQLTANNMQTIYLENTGNGFVLHTLPQEAQYAPVYAIVSADINKDGKKDLLLAGNNTYTRIKFGRYTANHGVLLLGDGKGGFAYVPQAKSGLQLRANVKSMQVLGDGNKQKIIAGTNNGEAVMLNY